MRAHPVAVFSETTDSGQWRGFRPFLFHCLWKLFPFVSLNLCLKLCNVYHVLLSLPESTVSFMHLTVSTFSTYREQIPQIRHTNWQVMASKCRAYWCVASLAAKPLSYSHVQTASKSASKDHLRIASLDGFAPNDHGSSARTGERVHRACSWRSPRKICCRVAVAHPLLCC